uniref:Uncharacterized protein n=1 Tax=Gadus morhua TaxID=8049 RepID=A0A8C5C3W4_GADMO
VLYPLSKRKKSILREEKAFDRVWHAALWATMRKYNISPNLVRVIQHLYNKATSAVLYNGSLPELPKQLLLWQNSSPYGKTKTSVWHQR